MLRVIFVSLNQMYVKFVEIPAMCIGFDTIIGEVKGLAKFIILKKHEHLRHMPALTSVSSTNMYLIKIVLHRIGCRFAI